MTVATEDLVDSASIAAASTKRKGLWRLAIRNPNVIVGGTILLIMLAIAALAPLLGTVDPTRIDPASRNKKPGTEITMRLDDGQTVILMFSVVYVVINLLIDISYTLFDPRIRY